MMRIDVQPGNGVRCFCEWPRTGTISSGSVATSTGKAAGPRSSPCLCSAESAPRGWRGGSVGWIWLVFGAPNTGVRYTATRHASHKILHLPENACISQLRSDSALGKTTKHPSRYCTPFVHLPFRYMLMCLTVCKYKYSCLQAATEMIAFPT